MNQVHIELDKLPKHETEALCRTVSASIHRLMNDPAMKADYEAWRAERCRCIPRM